MGAESGVMELFFSPGELTWIWEFAVRMLDGRVDKMNEHGIRAARPPTRS